MSKLLVMGQSQGQCSLSRASRDLLANDGQVVMKPGGQDVDHTRWSLR